MFHPPDPSLSRPISKEIFFVNGVSFFTYNVKAFHHVVMPSVRLLRQN